MNELKNFDFKPEKNATIASRGQGNYSIRIGILSVLFPVSDRKKFSTFFCSMSTQTENCVNVFRFAEVVQKKQT